MGTGTDRQQRMRDFATDSEEHKVSRREWHRHRGDGVTLYAKADFFVAYWDDAAVLWEESDDELPMFHVMIRSDPPDRTLIHSLHLAAWVRHLTGKCVPVLILGHGSLTAKEAESWNDDASKS